MPKQPSAAKKARRVKNPESFRERAIKTSASRKHKSRLSFVGKLIKPVFRPIIKASAKATKRLAKVRFFRSLKKPLRIIGKILLVPYFVQSFHELKQVTWPSWKQGWRLTYAVLSFAIVFGASIAGLDWVLSRIFKEILIK